MSTSAVLGQLRYTFRHRRVRLALVATTVSAVAMAAVVLLLWWPARHAHQTLVDAIDTQRRVVVDALHARDLAHSYGEATKIVPTLESKLTRAASQAELVTQVEKLARRHGVRIISEAYEEGKNKGAHVPLYLDLALQGPYHSLRQFLRDIPTLPMWSEAQELRLERSREHRGLRAQVRIVTYRRATVAAAGAS